RRSNPARTGTAPLQRHGTRRRAGRDAAGRDAVFSPPLLYTSRGDPCPARGWLGAYRQTGEERCLTGTGRNDRHPAATPNAGPGAGITPAAAKVRAESHRPKRKHPIAAAGAMPTRTNAANAGATPATMRLTPRSPHAMKRVAPEAPVLATPTPRTRTVQTIELMSRLLALDSALTSCQRQAIAVGELRAVWELHSRGLDEVGGSDGEWVD